MPIVSPLLPPDRPEWATTCCLPEPEKKNADNYLCYKKFYGRDECVLFAVIKKLLKLLAIATITGILYVLLVDYFG